MRAKKTNAPRETRYTACAPNHSSAGSKPAAPPAALAKRATSRRGRRSPANANFEVFARTRVDATRVAARQTYAQRSSALAPRRAALERRRARVISNGLFGLGLPEIVVIGGVAAVLFGPSKLPELGKSLGKTVKSFQEAAKVRGEGVDRASARDGRARAKSISNEGDAGRGRANATTDES